MARELPIFPLPIVLFPGAPQSLHIFEPRYRRLLSDCLAADRRFGIAYVAAERAPGADPARAGCPAGAAGAPQHHRPAAPARRPARAAGGGRAAAGGGAAAGQAKRGGRRPPPGRAHDVTGPALIEGLAGIVGPRHVRTAPAERLTYARDGLPTHSRLPGVVVLPGTRDEVLAVPRRLAAHRVPFVPRRAGPGPPGGALANGGAVLVVL